MRRKTAAVERKLDRTTRRIPKGGGQASGKGKEISDSSAMDDESLRRLAAVNEELIHLCSWLNRNRDFETASKVIPIVQSLTRLVVEQTGQRKIQTT